MGRQRRLKLTKRAAAAVVTGIAWYRRDQWPRLREVAADPEILEETYDGWLMLAEDAMRKLARKGIKPQPLDIDVEELVSWCREKHRPIDQGARAAFASFKVQESHDATSNKPLQPTRAAQPSKQREPSGSGPGG
jgi:hypothetical protein